MRSLPGRAGIIKMGVVARRERIGKLKSTMSNSVNRFLSNRRPSWRGEYRAEWQRGEFVGKAVQDSVTDSTVEASARWSISAEHPRYQGA